MEYISESGEKLELPREIYDSGNGATVFLYNPVKKTVILTRQFRLASHIEGHVDGRIIECCAGMLDENDPESTIKKEILEETGYQVESVNYLFSAYATPGAHTEKIAFFTAEHDNSDKVSDGGGLASEHEDIEVLEYSFQEILNLYHNNQLEDSKTIIMVQHAIISGILNI